MLKLMAEILLVVILFSLKLCTILANKMLLADITTNKLTRSHDGSFGLWSFHGVAKESHASQTSFVYNADLLSPDGQDHVDIASTVYPRLGLTSDQDLVYQEYLILQAKVIGIDGFLIEWGYMNHSSDRALQSYLQLAKKHSPFKIAVNWQVVDIFHSNLQYLLDTVYSQSSNITHGDSPVIFLFGGGLNSAQFKDLLSIPLSLPPGEKSPVWIGSYLNYASTPELWAEWGDLLNGTFGWAPRVDTPTPGNMSQWDYYDNTDAAVQYQLNVSKFGSACVSAGGCALWCGSVSPGFDNRGCAGWGKELRYIPRQDLNNASRYTYDAQWEYYLGINTSVDYIVIPTMNDFPEATPILPLRSSSFRSLYSTARYTGSWKGDSIDPRGVVLPSKWYTFCKEMQFYNRTPGIDVHSLEAVLEAAGSAINRGSLNKAHYLLKRAGKLLENFIKPLVKVENRTLEAPGPSMTFSSPPVIVDQSYVVNQTTFLYLLMADDVASTLRQTNFRGLLMFQYQPLYGKSSQHFLRVVSSTKSNSALHKYHFMSKGLAGALSPVAGWRSWEHSVMGDRSEVCKLWMNGTNTAAWYNATVALYKENQSWDHSALHGSDLVFMASGRFAIRNISLQFTIYSKR